MTKLEMSMLEISGSPKSVVKPVVLTYLKNQSKVRTSVVDLDPDPYVFGPPGFVFICTDPDSDPDPSM